MQDTVFYIPSTDHCQNEKLTLICDFETEKP